MAQPSALVKILAPRIPLMLKTALWHTFSASPTSTKWDLRTDLIINVLRSIMGQSTSSISKQQEFGLKDPGAKGQIWISRVTFSSPAEDDVRQLLFKVIDELKETEQETYTQPATLPIEAEWQGYRGGVAKDAPEPKDMGEEEKYANMMAEVESEVTVLYFHGGAYYLMDPATHRQITSRLAKKTRGRVLSVRYRLAPQHPFPSALLDALVAYLSLLYPPKGALHKPVLPEHIVFAGDSAGGNLCAVLLQTLLHAHRQSSRPTVQFNGVQVKLPLPAGLALNSPWFDITRCMPSLFNNEKYDYLPPPSIPTGAGAPTSAPPSQTQTHSSAVRKPPPCKAWPANPPRADLYCDGSMLCHPLISPLALPAEKWQGAPPMMFTVGEEMLADEIKVVARQVANAGTKMRLLGYEAMPHVFAMLLEGIDTSKKCINDWAGWIEKAVKEGEKGLPSGVKWTRAKTAQESEVDLAEFTNVGLSDEEVRERMKLERERRRRVFAEEMDGASKL